jgi:uncharacterized protein (DUF1800 family)
MRSKLEKLVLLLLCLSLVSAVPRLLASKKDKVSDASANEQKRALQALNRLTFGPRPGDVQQVAAMGVDRWIDLQLHPEKISDSAVENRLAAFRTLHMSGKEIIEEFPDNQIIRQIMDGKKSMPSDPAKRAVIQVQIARYQERQQRKSERKVGDQTASNGRPSDATANPPNANSGNEQASPSSQGSGDSSAADSAAADSAKTAEELAAEAAASPDAMPGTPADNNTATDGMTAATTDAPAKMPGGDASAAASTDPQPNSVDDAEARRREDRLYADLKIQGMMDLSPTERYKKVMAMSTAEQVVFGDSMRGGKGLDFLAGMDPKQKETLLSMNSPQAAVLSELVQAKLLRAIYSERQLDEVMTDFWFNHFNVFVGKGPERVLVTNYEQNVIRPHALGKFEDLLLATAKSPAMLFYLDNWISVGPNSMQGQGIPERRPLRPYGPYGRYPRYPQQNPNAKRKQNKGLNENYGRELLELHTLSVNGGYSQRDVTEVAKVFTGWTIEKPADGMGFKYEPRMHEPGPKFVLGHEIKFKGEDEGKEVLHMLATSPQTAHFISLKLAQRFVSDDPPPALVDNMAKTFEKTKGDIREVLATLFHSPEFWAENAYRAKMKTPLEFVASAVRATGADVDDAFPLAHQIEKLGMPLYSAQPPTGYSMKADTWVSSSALLGRMNFALGMTSGKVRGVKVDAVQLAGGPPPPPDSTTALSTLEAKLLAGDVSKQTHDSIIAQLEAPSKNAGADSPEQKQDQKAVPRNSAGPPDASTIAGLLLGSPEFQKR